MSDLRVPNLKRLRTERNLTQIRLATAIGVAERAIYRWEHGEGEPSIHELRRLAAFFGVSVDQLLDDLLTPFVSVAALTGRALDYWVARARGFPVQMVDGEPKIMGERPVAPYSTDWASAGPLIWEYKIHLTHLRVGQEIDGVRLTADACLARCDGQLQSFLGTMATEAAMRAFVATKFGPQIVE